MRDQDVERIARMLKAAVQFSGVSHRQIERAMGLSTGYLSRIFSGRVELRVQHVLGVCHAIGLPPGAFFEAAYPLRDYDRETARLVAALQELMPEAGEDALPGKSGKPGKPGKSRKAEPPPPAGRQAALAARVNRISAAVKARQNPQLSPTAQLRRMLEAVLEEMNQRDTHFFDVNEDYIEDDEP